MYLLTSYLVMPLHTVFNARVLYILIVYLISCCLNHILFLIFGLNIDCIFWTHECRIYFSDDTLRLTHNHLVRKRTLSHLAKSAK